MSEDAKVPVVEIRCPLNFTVRVTPPNFAPRECGQALCCPATCARLQMAAEQLKNEGKA